ncbi:hypothetical protein KI387_012931, partial [Taxus chinensis]
MKFATDVREACSAGLFKGKRLKKLDLPEISAPVVLESEGVSLGLLQGSPLSQECQSADILITI